MKVFNYKKFISIFIFLTLLFMINDYLIKNTTQSVIDKCIKQGYIFHNNKIVYCNSKYLLNSQKSEGATDEKIGNY